jgi:hydrogenase expression/formation protein HypE
MDDMKNSLFDVFSCPLPVSDYDVVTMAHGGGGKIMNNLIEKMFLHYLSNDLTAERHDGAVIDIGGMKLASSTDSYVVDPIFFPGGNIGELAVFGTVNDLSMCGAVPLYLSLGLIIEEGFFLKDLEKIIHSIQSACSRAGVRIVTGDTKVVEKNKGDGIFISTAGIGVIENNTTIAPSQVKPGDSIIISGDIGRHGIAIMASREKLDFETSILSDCAPLNDIVKELISSGVRIHCLRDLTRGGLASALNEIASSSGLHINIEENRVHVTEEVRGVCEILGFDPMYVANEGRFVAFVDKDDEEKAMSVLKAFEACTHAQIIGNVSGRHEKGLVTIRSFIGVSRILDMLSGEQLPRIC